MAFKQQYAKNLCMVVLMESRRLHAANVWAVSEKPATSVWNVWTSMSVDIAYIHRWGSGTFASRKWMKVLSKFPMVKIRWTYLLHVHAVCSDLVCRLPGKLYLCLVAWHTPEAIYLQLVGGCVRWWCHLAVKRRGYKFE